MAEPDGEKEGAKRKCDILKKKKKNIIRNFVRVDSENPSSLRGHDLTSSPACLSCLMICISSDLIRYADKVAR